VICNLKGKYSPSSLFNNSVSLYCEIAYLSSFLQKTIAMIKIITTFVILLISVSVYSQSVISGTVKDEKGEFLPGANIYFQGTYEGTSSNVDGSFKIKTNLSGKQILLIEFLGFETISKELLLANTPIHLNLILKEAFNKLKAVTITAGTFEAGDKKKSVTLSSIDMLTTAGAIGDVYGALKMLPGVTANPESGKLFVKGGSSEESKTYINGLLVQVPYTSSVPNMGARGRFNPFIFGGTVFSTGGYSAEYGQALSSVLLLETKDLPVQDQWDISIMSVGGDLAMNRIWKGGGITATAKYNNLKPYMSIVPQNYTWHHYPESFGGELSLQQNTKNGRVKVYASYGSSTLSVDQENPNDFNQAINYDLKDKNVFVNAYWKEGLNQKLYLKSGMSFTNNSKDININSETIDNTLNGFHMKSVLLYELSPKILIKSGAEYNYQNYEFGYESTETDFFSSFKNNQFSAFTETELYTSNKFVSRLGARIEYSDYLESFNFSPRFSTAYKLSKEDVLSFSWGWFYQNPYDDYLIYTNHLKPERSDHYTLSFQHIKNNRVLKLDLYYKDYKNLVRYESDNFFMPDAYNNEGKGHAGGLDFFWRDKKSITNLEYWVSYSYLDTKRLYRDFPTEVRPSFASKHNLSIVGKYFFRGMRSLAGFTYRYGSPRNYNDPNSNQFYSAKTKAYNTIDLNWTFLYRDNIIFYFSATNVFGFKQEFGYRYAESQNEEGFYNKTPPSSPGQPDFFSWVFITLSKKGDVNQLDKIE